jgi:RimJ/RimL family protein N-acetyltransferase
MVCSEPDSQAFDIRGWPTTISTMLEPFTRAMWPEVARFARRLPNFDYLKTIVRLHLDEKRPRGCFVWRAQGRVAAFCGLIFLNSDDAWLYGMRVAPAFRDRGIATRFTRELTKIAASDGRSWVGLNTSDQPSHRPVFRIAEKLGMRLEGVYCNDGFWSLRSRRAVPRLRRHPDIFGEFLNQGRTTIFHDTGGWFWSRLLPARRDWVDANGFILEGVPVHIMRLARPQRGRSATVNLLQLPPDPRPLLARLLVFAQGRNWLVVNYPQEWKRTVRPAWKELAPTLRRNQHYHAGAERVCGKSL